jgi:hypothetical protein
MVQGLDKVDQLLTLTMAAYNLTRLADSGQLASADRVMSTDNVAMSSLNRPNTVQQAQLRPSWRTRRTV